VGLGELPRIGIAQTAVFSQQTLFQFDVSHSTNEAPAIETIGSTGAILVSAGQILINPIHQRYLRAGAKLTVYNCRGHATPIMLKYPVSSCASCPWIDPLSKVRI